MQQNETAAVTPGGTVDFGFEEVAATEKSGMVRSVFERVAERYDLMNDVMSAGVHRLWKANLLDWLAPRAGSHLLDVAGGTGDVARGYLKRTGGRARATVCDINAAMLSAGRGRRDSRDASGAEVLQWACGDAEHLPFPDASFDAVTIAFGIRNVTNRDAALADMRRVLRPGGRFMCLEFSRVVVPGLDAAYRTYAFEAIPRLGRLVAGDEAAYRYLVESIWRFPDQETFADMMARAGFARVRFRNLSGGIAALHSGWRL